MLSHFRFHYCGDTDFSVLHRSPLSSYFCDYIDLLFRIIRCRLVRSLLTFSSCDFFINLVITNTFFVDTITSLLFYFTVLTSFFMTFPICDFSQHDATEFSSSDGTARYPLFHNLIIKTSFSLFL